MVFRAIVITFCACALALGQDIVGTWTLVAAHTIKANGDRLEPFGAHPSGLLTYSADGHMSAVITSDGRKRSKEKDRYLMTPSEQAEAFSTVIAYAGTYSVEGGKVTHHVQISSYENWVGTDQTRLLRLEGRRLTLTSLNSIGGDQARTDLIFEHK
jgi:hypothetical protein